MKTKNKGLAYWKGRKLDARVASKQALEHYRLMLHCETKAIRAVNKLEQILLRAIDRSIVDTDKEKE